MPIDDILMEKAPAAAGAQSRPSTGARRGRVRGQRFNGRGRSGTPQRGAQARSRGGGGGTIDVPEFTLNRSDLQVLLQVAQLGALLWLLTKL